MMDTWREVLYPLGFISGFLFFARMLVQWLTSEAKGKSTVTPSFWKLSLCGNLMLAAHSFIQMQFHVCVIQAINAVISWRNLNLMQPIAKQSTMRHTVGLLILSVCVTTALFFLQKYLFFGDFAWFRIPSTPWHDNQEISISLAWHLMGFLGLALFNSRFWLQWWLAEKKGKSYLGAPFWWIGLVGEVMSLAYFLPIRDVVNSIGPALGLIPYIRNLMLIYQPKQQEA